MARRPASIARSIVAVAAVITIAAACSSGSDDSSGDSTTSASTTDGNDESLPGLVPLHATRGESPAIVDDKGRQVLLRGMNINGLGDYYQANPDLPTVAPIDEADFEQMAELGFDVIRLILSWSRLEPEPGVIDEGYIDEIRTTVEQAGDHGLYVVLDMHQDAFGKFIATPDGETCPDGTGPAKGWDGAPEWATITDGASTCIIGDVRESSPASVTAFESFWTNRDGIQDNYVDAWSALATAFAADARIAGYDLINEPSPGSGADQEPGRLGEFYGRLIDAIRAAEREVDDGFDHIVFFEPHAAWSSFGTMPVPPPDFTDDTNLVFAPHLYGGSIASVPVEQGFTYAADAAATFGVTFWSGEWGWFEENDENLAALAEYARLEDQYRVGGTWWQWFQACGDPHSVSIENDFEPAAELTHFRRTGCPGDEDLGPVEGFAAVLSRAYPRAAPGRLTLLESDPETGIARIEGETDPEGSGPQVVDVWVPARGSDPPQVSGEGLGDVTTIEVPGGFRLLIEVAANTYRIDIGSE